MTRPILGKMKTIVIPSRELPFYVEDDEPTGFSLKDYKDKYGIDLEKVLNLKIEDDGIGFSIDRYSQILLECNPNYSDVGLLPISGTSTMALGEEVDASVHIYFNDPDNDSFAGGIVLVIRKNKELSLNNLEIFQAEL